MRPKVGDVVHYYSHGSPVLYDGSQRYPSKPRAAMITDVPAYLVAEPYDGCPNGMRDHEDRPMWLVSLAVLNPTGVHFDLNVPYAETPEPGCWSWPVQIVEVS
ncbi:hypothetical protein [Streptomyces sp. CB03911]|uniref:hypothetical protein n=1 Tax=Streptomyces sp. CB03911 TaxID=1804758 RepID=UPI000938E3C1|nr:hypothetical protein [Streptomyces sp. CB03911]OKI19322.1 hypothetical protein A6A07_07425 [Streptomyces sp. CB03911]